MRSPQRPRAGRPSPTRGFPAWKSSSVTSACRTVRVLDLLPGLCARIGPAHPVAITARGLPEDEARSREAGFQAHLAKPFTLHGLVELLTGWRRRGVAAPKRRGKSVKPRRHTEARLGLG